jgi:hypothetical protein
LRFPIFFEFFWFFLGLFGIYTEKRKFPKTSDIFKWPQCENLPPKKKCYSAYKASKGTMLSYVLIFEWRMVASKPSRAYWLPNPNLEYSIQFLSSHTHIPPLSPRTPKHNSPNCKWKCGQ